MARGLGLGAQGLGLGPEGSGLGWGPRKAQGLKIGARVGLRLKAPALKARAEGVAIRAQGLRGSRAVGCTQPGAVGSELGASGPRELRGSRLKAQGSV